MQLVEESPKHNDTRQDCYKISTCIKKDELCRDGIWKFAMYMRNRIVMLSKYSDRVVKRNRKFIIASSIILIGELEYLKSFMGYSKGGRHV